ncbi:hypothetical protein SLNWT_0960 [Streptomyces albus]|uniref:Uncharacterized protein n=1 Tax=Streptomyces albus (strain ATCC 21838 / DSM 41398 / FERM P-419 / JCM 4703 / NBRC 107858) TaxID=1081613 RepID=A0A0B5ERG4_STRA4|nr:hypothetical protein SLNWT_0960 [Streptomyces albus]AOU75650.1 hypothetical protein SLNHY_0959 [Streptomyces albus]
MPVGPPRGHQEPLGEREFTAPRIGATDTRTPVDVEAEAEADARVLVSLLALVRMEPRSTRNRERR